MTRIEKSTLIRASPEKIGSIAQFDRLPEWQAEWKSVEWTSEEKNKVGSTLHLVGEVSGFKSEIDLELTEFVENEKAAWRTIGGNMTGIGSMTFSPVEDGTKFSMVIDYELPYSVLGKLIDKLRVRKAIDKSYDEALKRLKDMAEK
jgi:coenzyme Q-binding protein COQ10